MRLATLIFSTLLFGGCNEWNRDKDYARPAAPEPNEEILHIGPDTLPAPLIAEISEFLESVGGTTTIKIPTGSRYVVRVYRNNGASEFEVIREAGSARSDSLEIGLYCIKDYEVSEGHIRIDQARERVALDLPASMRTENLPPWGYRPIVFHRKNVTPSADELAVIVMYHGNEMSPDSFDDAVRFARERHVESLVATIQLTETHNEQDGGAKRE